MGLGHSNSVEIEMNEDKSLRITPVPDTRQDEGTEDRLQLEQECRQ